MIRGTPLRIELGGGRTVITTYLYAVSCQVHEAARLARGQNAGALEFRTMQQSELPADRCPICGSPAKVAPWPEGAVGEFPAAPPG